MWAPIIFIIMTAKKLKYLALGDSYTIGEGILEVDSFPNQLIGLISRDGITVEQRTIAKTGWTTTDLIKAFDTTQSKGKFNIITMLIGVNNQYQGKEVAKYEVELNKLIRSCILVTNKKSNIYLISIPDYGNTLFAIDKGLNSESIARGIDVYNTITQRLAKENGINYVEITDLTRDEKNRNLLTGDGLHPNKDMYALIAKRIFTSMNSNPKI